MDFTFLCLDLILFSLIWLLIIIGFGVWEKHWVKRHIMLYILLVVSSIGTVGNFYPIFWEQGAKYYNVIYTLSISYISAFIFYWITIALKENKQELHYSFDILKYFTSSLKLIAEIYYKDKYKDLKCDNYIGTFIFDVPIDLFLKELKQNLSIFNQEVENFNIRIKGNKKNIISMISVLEEKGADKNNDSLIYFRNSLNDVIKDDMFFKEYLNFCEKSHNFKGILDNYRNFAASEDYIEINDIFNIYTYWANKDKEGYEYLLKNYSYHIDNMEKIILKRIKKLKRNNKFIPSIRVDSNIFIGSEFKLKIINDYYPNILEGHILIYDKTKETEIKIKEFHESFFIGENNEKYYLENLCQISNGNILTLLFKKDTRPH